MYRLAIAVVVVFHFAVLVANVAAFWLLPLYHHWTIAVPLMTLIAAFIYSSQACWLTDLENYLRRQTGAREIHGFTGHYILKTFNPHHVGRQEQGEANV